MPKHGYKLELKLHIPIQSASHHDNMGFTFECIVKK